jgi:hypothetical protein
VAGVPHVAKAQLQDGGLQDAAVTVGKVFQNVVLQDNVPQDVDLQSKTQRGYSGFKHITFYLGSAKRLYFKQGVID